MTKVVLTGGGTAGHVMGNLAILPGLRERGYDIVYIGSEQGIERELISKVKLPYYPISSGKLRRYASFENLKDIFRVLKGIKDARKALKAIRPDIIFSKGGYVTVPVAIAAGSLKIPFIGHESDITPGLANKLASRYAKKMLVTFPETQEAFGPKGITVGSPVRQELFEGSRTHAYEFLDFEQGKPLLLIMGGSMGAMVINRIVWDSLDELVKHYQIAHITGGDHVNPDYPDRPGYRQFGYVGQEMKHLLTAADFIVSRAGSNSIFEFLAMHKPHLLIPLDYDQSRGDQVLNAESFENAGYSLVIREKDLTTESFLKKLAELDQDALKLKGNMKRADLGDGVNSILRIIDDTLEDSRQKKEKQTERKEAEASPLNFRKNHSASDDT